MDIDPTRAAEIVVEQRHIEAAQSIYDTIPLFAMGHVKARPSHDLVQAFARFEASLRPATPSPVTDEAALSGEALEARARLQAIAEGHDVHIVYGREWCALPATQIRSDLHTALASTPQPAAAECPFCTGPVPDSPLQKLGAYLADILDDDHWATAEQYLNAAIRQSTKGGER